MPTNQPNPLRRCELQMTLAVLKAIEAGCEFEMHIGMLSNKKEWFYVPTGVLQVITRLTYAVTRKDGCIKRGPWLADAIEKVKGELNDAEDED